MARTSVEDPIKVFRFQLEIDGFARYGFREAAGLERTTEVTEYREGGDNETPKKSPGISKFGDITLKRGVIMNEGQNDYYNWAQEVYDVNSKGGNVRDFRRDVDLVEYERGGAEVRRWRVTEAWPSYYKPFSDKNATASDDSIEELRLTNEGFGLVQ